jgi:hypothetical protein
VTQLRHQNRSAVCRHEALASHTPATTMDASGHAPAAHTNRNQHTRRTVARRTGSASTRQCAAEPHALRSRVHCATPMLPTEWLPGGGAVITTWSTTSRAGARIVCNSKPLSTSSTRTNGYSTAHIQLGRQCQRQAAMPLGKSTSPRRWRHIARNDCPASCRATVFR